MSVLGELLFSEQIPPFLSSRARGTTAGGSTFVFPCLVYTAFFNDMNPVTGVSDGWDPTIRLFFLIAPMVRLFSPLMHAWLDSFLQGGFFFVFEHFRLSPEALV